MGSCTLLDVIQKLSLPLTVTINKPFIIEDVEVLHANQKITVLHRENVKLLIGVDNNGKTFRFNTLEKRNLYVDRVEVIDFVELAFPKRKDIDLRFILPNIYVLSNNSIEYYSSTIRKGEKFRFNPQSNQRFKDVSSLVRLVSSENKEIALPLNELLKSDFTFIRYMETVELQKFLTHGFVPQRIVFNLGSASKEALPTEVVYLREVREFDTILSVTELNGKLIYEIFELREEIRVSFASALVPPHVKALGTDTQYSKSVNEIRLSLVYDIYNFHFYGRQEVENILNNFQNFTSTKSKKKLKKCKSCSNILDIEEESNLSSEKRKSFFPMMWARLSERKMESKYKRKVSETHIYEEIGEF